VGTKKKWVVVGWSPKMIESYRGIWGEGRMMRIEAFASKVKNRRNPTSGKIEKKKKSIAPTESQQANEMTRCGGRDKGAKTATRRKKET